MFHVYNKIYFIIKFIYIPIEDCTHPHINLGLNNDVKINIMFFIRYYFLHTDKFYTPDYFS